MHRFGAFQPIVSISSSERQAAFNERCATAAAMRRTLRPAAWLLGAAFLFPIIPARAQQAPSAQPAQPQVSQSEDEDEIVIKGKPPRGSVIGDIPPQNVLRSKDVKATGATS